MSDAGSTPLLLVPKRSSVVGLLLLCAAFVAGGLWLGLRGEPFGFVCAGFFGLGVLAALVQLVPGSCFLRVDDTGITFASLFRRNAVPWSDIDEFCVVVTRSTGIRVCETVGFNLAPTYDRATLGRRFSRAVAGCEGALPDTYGMKAVELAALLGSRLEAARASAQEGGRHAPSLTPQAAHDRSAWQ